MQHEEKGRHAKPNALQRSETDRPAGVFFVAEEGIAD